MQEYNNLTDFEVASIGNYYRRFEIYLTLATIGFVGIVTISGSDKYAIADEFILFILAAILAVGLNFFGTLSSSNVQITHTRKGKKLIRKYFISTSPEIKSFIYRKQGISGTKFINLISRGIAGGSPKSLLVNSTISGILIIKTGIYFDYNPINIQWGIAIFFAIAFITSILHVVYSIWVYRIYGIT